MLDLLSDQHLRKILWSFSGVGPLIAIALLALCCWPRSRRPAIITLSLSTIGAAVATAWFHYAFVAPKWSNHSSAIWLLDRAAFRAAFAIIACGSAVAFVISFLRRHRGSISDRPGIELPRG